jgi:hypothetical protein
MQDQFDCEVEDLKMIGLSGHPCFTPALILISAIGPVLLWMVVGFFFFKYR